MKRIVVARKNLPSTWPFMLTWSAFVSQEVWEMPGWGIGVLWTLVGLVWLIVVIDVFTADYKDPFSK